MALSALFVSRARVGRGEPGKYYDGGNLILRIKPGGRASWVFRFSRAGKQTSIGLGSLRDVSLGDAREMAAQHRRTLAFDGDPLREKRARRAASTLTFDQAVERCIEDRKAGWRNRKHAGQWSSTIEAYASPTIGRLAVADVDTQHVIDILKPIWTAKPDTASRLRGRIEAVLDWAKLHGHREGENPARWRGHLSLVFPPVGKVRSPKHHAAVPIDQLPAAFAGLDALGTITAEAVQFCILTAARPGEVQQATWDEIDFDVACWQLPAEKYKTAKPHRVPLSEPALWLLERRLADRREGEDLIFPGNGEAGRPQWSTAMLAALRAASGVADATVHGSARATFDDWASERTAHPQKCIDLALGHGPKGKTKQAYRRSDLYEQRKPLMADWGRFLDGR
jgi:integrase